MYSFWDAQGQQPRSITSYAVSATSQGTEQPSTARCQHTCHNAGYAPLPLPMVQCPIAAAVDLCNNLVTCTNTAH
jgi:hypothetical protein